MNHRSGFRRFAIVAATLVLVVSGCSSSPPSPSTGLPSAPAAKSYDADVQKAYDEIVSKEMPGVSIDLVQMAKKEGKVTYYHIANKGVAAMVKAFEEQFPFIKVERFEATGGAVLERYQTEARAGKVMADVFIGSTLPAIDNLQKEGHIQQYRIANDAAYPAAVKVSGSRYPLSFSTIAFAWNPNKLTADEVQVMATWEGLASPKLSGKNIGVMDIASGGIAQSANHVIYKTYGDRIWKTVAKEPKIKLYNGTPPMIAALESGEIDFAAWASDTGLYASYLKGAPVRWLYPTPVAVAPYGQFISAKAPNPNAARLLHEYSFTKTGQTVFAETSTPSFRADVGDRRKVTVETWFKQPTDFFAVDYAVVDSEIKEVITLWNSFFKK